MGGSDVSWTAVTATRSTSQPGSGNRRTDDRQDRLAVVPAVEAEAEATAESLGSHGVRPGPQPTSLNVAFVYSDNDRPAIEGGVAEGIVLSAIRAGLRWPGGATPPDDAA